LEGNNSPLPLLLARLVVLALLLTRLSHPASSFDLADLALNRQLGQHLSLLGEYFSLLY
jgi:hypothetical protein